MILDIPAVADTDGVATSITWRSDNLYTYNLELWIPGSFTSGTFTDNETVLQEGFSAVVALANGLIKGGSQAGGPKLIVDALDGPVEPEKPLVGQSSAAVFYPTGRAYLPPNFFVYVDPPHNAAAYLLKPGTGGCTYERPANGGSRGQVKLAKPPRQGSTISFLQCVDPTFTIPVGCLSFTLQNISGADMFYRQFLPNFEANVIDTTSATFGEDAIVGAKLIDGQSVGFGPGEFTPGTSWMLCAASGVSNGAIVEFNY